MPKKPEKPVIIRTYEPDKERMIEAIRFAIDISRRQKAKEKEGAA